MAFVRQGNGWITPRRKDAKAEEAKILSSVFFLASWHLGVLQLTRLISNHLILLADNREKLDM